MLVGGGGERVTLKIVARHADEWNVWGDPAVLRHKMAILDGYCAELDRDPKSIQRSAVALLFMSKDAVFLDKMRERNLQQPSIIGTVAEVRDVVAEFTELGVDELIVPDFTLGAGAQKIAALDTFITAVAGR